MKRSPFGTGIMGGWQGGRRHWDTIHTGVLCPFCQEGQLYIGCDDSKDRHGMSPFYVGCSNNPRQGAICPWMEKTRQDGQTISEEAASWFKAHQGDLDAMATLIRRYVPSMRTSFLRPYLPEEHPIRLAYGPPYGGE